MLNEVDADCMQQELGAGTETQRKGRGKQAGRGRGTGTHLSRKEGDSNFQSGARHGALWECRHFGSSVLRFRLPGAKAKRLGEPLDFMLQQLFTH